jgi:methionyl-tRNA formyltransferase
VTTAAETYVVAGSRPWLRPIFDQRLAKLPGQWHFVAAREELTLARLKELKPRYVFFLHWSWIVPTEITSAFECVCFHMTDVPYGRGGSPLQNLIERGHEKTRLTALRMADAVDAGPVYRKADLSLSGTAEQIYVRAANLSADLVAEMIVQHPAPLEQQGEPTLFVRRKPEQSAIPPGASLDKVHDHIRMLDADGYPPAFLVYGGLRFEFRRSARYAGRVVADVVITEDSQ